LIFALRWKHLTITTSLGNEVKDIELDEKKLFNSLRSCEESMLYPELRFVCTGLFVFLEIQSQQSFHSAVFCQFHILEVDIC
jgi:hypothetical protein